MKMRLLPWMGAILLLAATVQGADGPMKFDQAALSQIRTRMEEFIARGEISGAVTLVATAEGVACLEAAGMANVAAKTPAAPNTIYWIASMTKPIAATAILMLHDQGKLSVEDVVEKYIPAFGSVKSADGKPVKITIRQLLTHTSGLAEATGEESRLARSLADLIPRYVEKPVYFEPGAKWQYNQSGINTLGRIVEVVSGQSLPEFLQQQLLLPLGMKDTSFYPSAEQYPRLAVPYRTLDGKLVEDSIGLLSGHQPYCRDRYPAANGGLFSTAPDYARFCRMILNGGTLDGRKYLSPEAVRLMTTLQTGELTTGFTPGNGWGLGWCVIRRPEGVTGMLSPGSFGHGGAYGTQAWIDPAKGIALILMVQRSNFPNSDASDVRRAFQAQAVSAIQP